MSTSTLKNELPVGTCFSLAGHLLAVGVVLVFGMFSRQMPATGPDVGMYVALVAAINEPGTGASSAADGGLAKSSAARPAIAVEPEPSVSPVRIMAENRQKKKSRPAADTKNRISVAVNPTAGQGAVSGSPAKSPFPSALSAPAASAALALPTPVIVRAQPKYKQNPAPVYPSLARKRGWQGKVVLEVVILVDGSIEEVRLHSGSGFALLDKAAIASVGQWRFWPEMHDGKAVPSKVLVPVNYTLN